MRQDSRGSSAQRQEDRGPESRPEASGRPPAAERGALRDARGDVRSELRDATRTKKRRKATVAQRAARDAAGNKARLLRSQHGRPTPRPRGSAKGPSVASLARERAVEAAGPREAAAVSARAAREIEDARGLAGRMERLGRTMSLEAAAAVRDIGRFRVVRAEALERFHAAPGKEAAHQLEIATLKAGKLVREIRPGRGEQAYLTLSREGKALAARLVPRGQRVYFDARKLREMRHDAAVYEAFQLARRDLEAQGNRVRLVRLDYQMKQELRREARDRAYEKAKGEGRNLKALPKDEQHARIRAEGPAVAAAHGLPASDEGAIEYPDLQIEYERPGGEIAHCNVEVVTEHYKSSQIEAKQAAGFECFSVGSPRLGLDLSGGSPSSRAPRAPMRSLAEELLSF